MMKMMLLSKEDFKGFNFNADQSGIDVLAQVCCVALEKFNRLKQKQRHHQNIINLGFQPQPQSAEVGNQEKALSSTSKKTIKIVRKERKAAADDDLDHDQEYQETHYHHHGINLRKTTSKRSRYDDNEHKDLELNVEPKKKIKKKKNRSRRIVRNLNFVRPARMDPDFVPDLPEIFRRRIDEMQGTGMTLVMQKQLTDTDLSPDHNRLMMPFTKIKDWDFLTENEKADLRAEGIMAVPMIEPEPVMKLTIVNMRQWDMAKPSGKASSCYVLRTAWKLVVQDNHLLPHEVAQVWSFRVHGRLHMALVVISRMPPPPPPPLAVGMASTSGSGSGGGSGSVGFESSASSGGGNSTESGSGQITSQLGGIESAPVA